MSQNTDELGFIPGGTVEAQYVKLGRYVIQHDERGRETGYILHGKPLSGGILTIAQAVIELDKRQRGYGEQAWQVVLERAQRANCRAVKLRCGADLPSNEFWQAVGMKLCNVVPGGERRSRDINVYMYDLWPRLFG